MATADHAGVDRAYTTRTSCRVCGGGTLVPLFSLGTQYVSDFRGSLCPVSYQHPPHDGCNGMPPIACPIELVQCPRCTLVQALHTAPQELLYRRHYWYKSSTTQTMRDALRDVAQAAERLVDLKAGDVVLDIGSNTGDLLRSYTVPGIIRVGVEPATNLVAEGMRGIDHLVNDFWEVTKVKDCPGWVIGKVASEFAGSHLDRQGNPLLWLHKPARVVTAIGMMYDMDEINPFVRGVARVLAPDGVFIAQLMCARQMLALGDVGNLCVKPDTLLLGDNVPISGANAGMKAFGRNGDLTEVKRTFAREYIGNMVHIKPMYLEPIVCTPEHPILIARMTYPSARCGYYRGTGVCHKPGGPKKHDTLSTSNVSPSHPTRDRRGAHSMQWVDAKDVCRGDFVVVPRLRETPLPTIDLKAYSRMASRGWRSGLTELCVTEEVAWALGLYVAEGHTGGPETNRFIGFTLSSKELHLVERLRKTFGSIGYKVTLIDRTHINNSVCAIVTCCALARAFREWFGCRAVEKRVPDFLMNAPKEIRKAFLRGLVAGDGYRRKNKIHYHTSSKVLALQVQLMAFSMGGMLGISYVKPYERTIRGKPFKSKDSWQLRGSSPQLAEIFGYEHTGTVMQQGYIGDDYILLPVKKVLSESYSGPVHNVETGDHTYLVSNAVVHNCHEHLEFYTLRSLEWLFSEHGLAIFDIQQNDVNGGSYRIFAGHKGKERPGDGWKSVSGAMLAEGEPHLALHDPQTYRDFFSRIDANRRRTVEYIREMKGRGKRIWIYGASTKGNVVAQWYGLTPDLIDAAADRSPEKWGKYMVGSGIRITSEAEFREAKPDLALVMPYAFLDEFVSREAAWRAGGGRFIVPIPELRIV